MDGYTVVRDDHLDTVDDGWRCTRLSMLRTIPLLLLVLIK